jgi:hypothetical protein
MSAGCFDYDFGDEQVCGCCWGTLLCSAIDLSLGQDYLTCSGLCRDTGEKDVPSQPDRTSHRRCAAVLFEVAIDSCCFASKAFP